MAKSFQEVLASMDPKQVMDLLARVGSTTYVIINKKGTSIVQDPGLGRPWMSKSKKVAEVMAKAIGMGSSVITLADGVALLIKSQIQKN